MLDAKEIIKAFINDFQPIITSIEESSKKIQKVEPESVLSDIDSQLKKANSLLRQLDSYQNASALSVLTEDKRNQEKTITTGFKSLNKPLSGGYYKSNIISIWSTPLMGMTAFLLSSAYYIAQQKTTVLYLTEQNIENWTLPRLKASLEKLNFELADIPLFFETVYRFENDTIEKLYKKYMPEIIFLDVKPNILSYSADLINNLKVFAQKNNCAILISASLGLSHTDLPLKIDELWKRDNDKMLFDISDVVLTLYRKIWSLENTPPEETGIKSEDKVNVIRWQEEIEYYKHRIDIECLKNAHGESFWKRHFYYEDCAFVLDKIPVRKYDDTI